LRIRDFRENYFAASRSQYAVTSRGGTHAGIAPVIVKREVSQSKYRRGNTAMKYPGVVIAPATALRDSVPPLVVTVLAAMFTAFASRQIRSRRLSNRSLRFRLLMSLRQECSPLVRYATAPIPDGLGWCDSLLHKG
jgi:hypothetical protein